MLEAADTYNKQMGAVDTGNQLRATEGLDHRNRRGGVAGNSLDLPA
jgi:hypothetical protein